MWNFDPTNLFNPPHASLRKRGGIWFARIWRIRISFCIASYDAGTFLD